MSPPWSSRTLRLCTGTTSVARVNPRLGRHSFARHLDDLVELLDAWDVPRAVLVGHSYGTDLASRFCLTHPDRVAAMLLMCGPFVGDWRTGDRAERGRCMSAAQLERLRAFGGVAAPHGGAGSRAAHTGLVHRPR
ncbi:alpha/beta fold hydrolase [Streptomyces niveus]